MDAHFAIEVSLPSITLAQTPRSKNNGQYKWITTKCCIYGLCLCISQLHKHLWPPLRIHFYGLSQLLIIHGKIGSQQTGLGIQSLPKRNTETIQKQTCPQLTKIFTWPNKTVPSKITKFSFALILVLFCIRNLW